MKRSEAIEFIKSLKNLREDATDATASKAKMAYQTLKQDGSLVTVGTRIRWNDTIKRAAVDLYDTAENNPENAPTLWEDINYVNGYRMIPEVITVGLAFSEGEIGWWGETLYKSLINSNVWTPDQNPSGWVIYTE